MSTCSPHATSRVPRPHRLRRSRPWARHRLQPRSNRKFSPPAGPGRRGAALPTHGDSVRAVHEHRRARRERSKTRRGHGARDEVAYPLGKARESAEGVPAQVKESAVRAVSGRCARSIGPRRRRERSSSLGIDVGQGRGRDCVKRDHRRAWTIRGPSGRSAQTRRLSSRASRAIGRVSLAAGDQ